MLSSPPPGWHGEAPQEARDWGGRGLCIETADFGGAAQWGRTPVVFLPVTHLACTNLGVAAQCSPGFHWGLRASLRASTPPPHLSGT